MDQLQTLANEMHQMLQEAQVKPLDPHELKRAFIAKDMQFHDTLLQAAGNALALQFHQLLVDYFSKGEHFLTPPAPVMAQEHLDVVRAIQNRDEFTACRAMVAHMLPILDMLKSRSEETNASEAPDHTSEPGLHSISPV